MHLIDHATAVNGEFVPGNPSIGQLATVVTADIMNAMMKEIAGVVTASGAQLNKADNTQLVTAIAALITAREDVIKPVGMVELLDDYVAPSASNPRFCLAAADQVITTTNWPQLVPYFRAKKLKYNAGIANEKSAFDVTGWQIATNVATLTFANTTAENAILAALHEDKMVHGSYTNWRTVTLGSAIGNISAGTYDITNVSINNRTIAFAFTAGNSSGSVTTTVEFYRHRLSSVSDPGGTQARHFAVQGRGFITVNDSAGEVIAGLRRRDRMQGHFHSSGDGNQNFIEYTNAGDGTTHYTSTAGTDYLGEAVTGSPSGDGTNGTPRTGETTDPRAFGVVPYIWGKVYNA